MKEGQPIVDAPIRIRTRKGWTHLNAREFFADQTVIVFALPGAFTPTCSSAHVPRYEELAPVFKARGVDEILCVSVNDTFVMDAWARDQGVERIRFVADGNGEFTKAMGLLVDKSEIGFGPRSWRYSMLVRNGVIEKMFVEPDKDGDPFEVSDADTMLRYIDPEGAHVPDIVMFSKPGCSHCARARKALETAGLPYHEITALPRVLRAVAKQATTPQLFIDGQHIGGADDLETWVGSRDAAA